MQTIEGQIPGFWLHVGVQPGREKIVFGGLVHGEHYTVIWKQGERKIDVHITYEDRSINQEKIFEISFFAMNRVLVQLKNLESLYKEYFSGRVTTLHKLVVKHKDWLLHPITGFADERVEWLELKDRRMNVRRGKRDHVTSTFLSPLEAAFYQDCHWQLFDTEYRWRGFMYQKIITGDTPEFIYVSKKRHDQFNTKMRRGVKEILQNVQYYSKHELF